MTSYLSRGSGSLSDINVVPYIDVMLVLLIIFMVTAPILTVGVPVDLPKTSAAPTNDDVEPIVISIDKDGQTFLKDQTLSFEALVDELNKLLQHHPDSKIYVRGDKNLAYGTIMDVMGKIASAGFTKVSLVAEMPDYVKPPHSKK